MSMSIGERLRSAREQRGWTVQQASVYTGVSAAHISRTENGKRVPSPRVIRQLADGYSENYEELMSLAGYLDRELSGPMANQERSVSAEFASLVERLPKERQAWYRDLVLFDLQKQEGFDNVMIAAAAGARA